MWEWNDFTIDHCLIGETVTCNPPLGRKVRFCKGSTTFIGKSSKSQLRSSPAKTIFISSIAKCCPMHPLAKKIINLHYKFLCKIPPSVSKWRKSKKAFFLCWWCSLRQKSVRNEHGGVAPHFFIIMQCYEIYRNYTLISKKI